MHKLQLQLDSPPYIRVDFMLLFVQACFGCGLHYFHQCATDVSFLLLFKGDIELVEEACGNTLLLLHQVLSCVQVEGDPK